MFFFKKKKKKDFLEKQIGNYLIENRQVHRATGGID